MRYMRPLSQAAVMLCGPTLPAYADAIDGSWCNPERG